MARLHRSLITYNKNTKSVMPKNNNENVRINLTFANDLLNLTEHNEVPPSDKLPSSSVNYYTNKRNLRRYL